MINFKQFLSEQEFGGVPGGFGGGAGPLGAPGGMGGPPGGDMGMGGMGGAPPMGGDMGAMGAPMGGAPMGGQPQPPSKPKTYDVWKTLKELLGMDPEKQPSHKTSDMISSPPAQHLMS